MTARAISVFVLACTMVVQPLALTAQASDGSEGVSHWRRWALAGAGALLLGGVASFTDQAGEQARTGVCDQTTCVVVIGGLLGGGLGFLLGSEWDKRVDRRAREGQTVDVALTSVDVAEGTTRLVESRRGIFALARDGVDFVDETLGRTQFIGGVQARAGVMTLDDELLVLGTNTQVLGLRVPDPLEEPVELIATGAASVTALDGDAIALGEPGRIRRMEVQGSAASPSLAEEASVDVRGLPAALALGAGGGVIWTLEDSALVSRNPSTLAEVGRLPLAGRALSVSFAGPLALVAMGNEGAALVDISSPTTPSLTTTLATMEFAYDAVALDGRIYVAAGAQGVFVYEGRGGEAPTREGVIRDADFAGDLLVRDGRLYILDRAASRLFRM